MNTARKLIVIVFATVACNTVAADFSTPETALTSYESAFTAKDLEAAVAAKDFVIEARELLFTITKSQQPDDALIQQTAEILEQSFRYQRNTGGFTDFSRQHCEVFSKSKLRPDMVEIIEVCVSSDGKKSYGTLYAASTSGGWRIVTLPPKWEKNH